MLKSYEVTIVEDQSTVGGNASHYSNAYLPTFHRFTQNS